MLKGCRTSLKLDSTSEKSNLILPNFSTNVGHIRCQFRRNCTFVAKKNVKNPTSEKSYKLVLHPAKTTSVFWIIFFLLNFHHSNQQTPKFL